MLPIRFLHFGGLVAGVRCSADPNSDGIPAKAFIPNCVNIQNPMRADALLQPNSPPPQPASYLGNDYFNPFLIYDAIYLQEEAGAGLEQYGDSILFEEGKPPVSPDDDPGGNFPVRFDPGPAPDSTDYTTIENPEANIGKYAVTPYDYDPYSPDENPDFISDSITYDSEMDVYYTDYYTWDTSYDVQMYYRYLGGEAQYQADEDAWGADQAAYTPIWNQEQAESDALAALNEWLGSCQPPIPPSDPNCCLQVLLDTDQRDFNGSTNILAQTPLPNCGELMCAEMQQRVIQVNTSDIFLDANREPDHGPVPSQYTLHTVHYTGWYTNPTQAPDLMDAYGAISFFQVMEHEIGHILGLNHPEDLNYSCTNCYTLDPVINDSNYFNPSGFHTVMAQGVNVAANSSLIAPLTLTDEDKCEFQKLYCPPTCPPTSAFCASSNVSSPSTQDLIDPKVFPNPTNNGMTLTFDVPERSYVQVTIYDILGNRLRLVTSGYFGQSSQSISLGTESLPSGHYVCRVQVGESVTYLDLVIQR